MNFRSSLLAAVGALVVGLLAPTALGPAAAAERPADAAARPTEARFAPIGPSSGPAGKGSFRFGVASSATQIEDGNTNTDWYKWTQPAPDGLGRSPFVGDGVNGYTNAVQDIALIKKLNVDSYRFGIEWARVEPRRGVIDEAALAHYSTFIDQLRANGIRPMVTVFHFALPTWVDNPVDPGCAHGPTDENLCGLDHPAGGALVVDEMAEYAGLLAQRFGDRVDDWGTINEPMVYMMFAQAFGAGPPGKAYLATNFADRFIPALRNLITAHTRMYKAVKAADRVDADRDGGTSSVGLPISVKQYVPVRDGAVSTQRRDIDAANRFRWFFELNFIESLWNGRFDTDFDGRLDEPHPEWRRALDWLGIQLYDRTGVTDPDTPSPTTLPVVNIDNCGAPPCHPVLDPTYFVPALGYETDPRGLYPVLKDFSSRFPGLPLMVTESGIATETAARRSQIIVRALEQIGQVRREGVDVRGYYHWSLLDNFEWLSGYAPRFGLYAVDRTTMQRTPTESVAVYAEIARTRRLSGPIVVTYGGSGPLTPEGS